MVYLKIYIFQVFYNIIETNCIDPPDVIICIFILLTWQIRNQDVLRDEEGEVDDITSIPDARNEIEENTGSQ